MVDVNFEIKRYVSECLEKEERKPVGLCGHWAYYLMKEKEYKEMIGRKNEIIQRIP
jgi:hypothetical protein